MAEFAQVAAVFFLLLFGIIEMGTVIYRYTSVCMAAREATRYAAVHSTTSQNPAGSGGFPTVQQYAVNFAPFLDLNGSGCAGDASPCDVVVSYVPDTTPHLNNQNDAVVTITYIYTQQIPFMSPITLNLSSSSKMLVSQ